MDVYREECAKVGLDESAVAAIARRIERACADARKLGLTVFMGSTCSLSIDDGGQSRLIVAGLDIPNADGGCGSYGPGDDGLTRGE